MYNIADTWVVGRFLGADALAAVGSSYTLMTFLTSILLGLCMGSGAAISMVPLIFLAVSAILNVVLDLLCVIVLGWGVAGAAAVKIDSFAYMPVQDFGNAFSTYVAQNYGAGKSERIRKGIRSAGLTSAAFCILISVLVCAFAAPLMGIFVDPGQSEIIAAGVRYLRIEGACYIGIGILFLLYGYYRAVNKPMMSVILTIASLGTRVALAYLLSATPLGVTGIWLSVPIGWALADGIGIGYYLKTKTA